MASIAFVLLFALSAVMVGLCIIDSIYLKYPFGLIMLYFSAFIFCIFLVATYSYFALLIYWDQTSSKAEEKLSTLLIQADEIHTLEPDISLIITQVAITIPTPILEKKVPIIPILAKIPVVLAKIPMVLAQIPAFVVKIPEFPIIISRKFSTAPPRAPEPKPAPPPQRKSSNAQPKPKFSMFVAKSKKFSCVDKPYNI